MELTTKCFDEDILFLRHCCLAIKFREVFVDNMSTYVNEVKLIQDETVSLRTCFIDLSNEFKVNGKLRSFKALPSNVPQYPRYEYKIPTA